MDTLKAINDLITAVTDNTEKIGKQFNSKSVTRTEKETILSSTKDINIQMINLKAIAEKLKIILETKKDQIQDVVKCVLHSQSITTPAVAKPSYSNIVQNRKPIINKNKIIIKADNIDAFDKQVKSKVNLAKENVQVTFYKKLNNNTAIINTASKADSEKLADLIKSRVTDCKVTHEKLLDPTILLFRTNNVTEDDVRTYFQESFGSEPVTITKVQGAKGSRIYIRCTPEQYRQLPADKRLRINWESLAFTDSLNPRYCKKCLRFGHSEKYCKAEDNYTNFVNNHKEHTCVNCLYTAVSKSCQYKDIHTHLINTEFVKTCAASIEHTTLDKNCPVYLKAVENLTSKINFG